jgi:hypothetical protein
VIEHFRKISTIYNPGKAAKSETKMKFKSKMGVRSTIIALVPFLLLLLLSLPLPLLSEFTHKGDQNFFDFEQNLFDLEYGLEREGSIGL